MSELTAVFTDDPSELILRPIGVRLALRSLGWAPDQLAHKAGVNVADVRDLVAGYGIGHLGPMGLAALKTTLLAHVYLPAGGSIRGLILKPEVRLAANVSPAFIARRPIQ